MAVYTKLSEIELKNFFKKYNLGEVINYKVHKKNNCSYSGSLLFKNSRVSWLLSVDREDLPSGHGASPST